MAEHLLDNPIWNALTTRQQEFAQGTGLVRAFRPEFNTLAALAEPSEAAFAELAQIKGADDAGILFHQLPQFPAGWSAKTIPVSQMVCEKPVLAEVKEEFVELTAADVPEMTELTTLTRPGPWRPQTIELGRYVEIKKDGKLAAMSGERMRVPGMTEVSAVCTHPEHTGHGYAAQLMSVIMRGIQQRGEGIFLHVRSDNARAIALYERLGFAMRTEFQFALMRWSS
jgi:GNAT superfamily N-acetyltransferase